MEATLWTFRIESGLGGTSDWECSGPESGDKYVAELERGHDDDVEPGPESGHEYNGVEKECGLDYGGEPESRPHTLKRRYHS